MFNPTILLYEFDGVIGSIGRNVSLLEEISLGDTEAEESLEPSTPPPGTAHIVNQRWFQTQGLGGSHLGQAQKVAGQVRLVRAK